MPGTDCQVDGIETVTLQELQTEILPEGDTGMGLNSKLKDTVNVLGDTSLVYAFSETRKQVGADIVDDVLVDKKRSIAPVQKEPSRSAASAAMAGNHSNMIEKLFGN